MADKESKQKDSQATPESNVVVKSPYMQNRELSWLTFDQRVLDQGADPNVPLLERLQFVSIFWSNLQEFFMVRVGSLTDLMLVKKEIIDTKSGMTPAQQLDAIYARCDELYPLQEATYHQVIDSLAEQGVHQLTLEQLSEEQAAWLRDYMESNVLPILNPQIINARHPFPHLENGGLNIIARLEENTKSKDHMTKAEKAAAKEARKKAKDLGAEGIDLGIVPMPKKSPRIIKLPGDGFSFILLENALEMMTADIFSMYKVKHTNIICVTRNADLDATEGADEREEDYREHMKRILKKRARLAPVRLESAHKLSTTVSEFLLKRLNLRKNQVYTTSVPLDMGYAFALAGMVDDDVRARLTSTPFSPAWPAQVARSKPMIEQVQNQEILLSYPYESMEPFIELLREASVDPDVVSIKITLYRLASQSHLAEALITAAENGKEVTALFELRARFDESNNIEWSQRFEDAGANVIYGFHEYKVHSKICCITRQTEQGLQYITQLGTGNYNEKTAKLYTDFSFITTDSAIGRDAMEFFRNMGLENTSRAYRTLWVAPLQIKQNIMDNIDRQIERQQNGEKASVLIKTNSVTDREIIEKLVEASQAGVPVKLFVRGISCLVPGVPGYTDNVEVFSIVGRLLEHSRIYAFGPREDLEVYLSSADLMTRNMEKRIEIAWPVTNKNLLNIVIDYLNKSMDDTAKLRYLKSDGTYTPVGDLKNNEAFNSQEYFIKTAQEASEAALTNEGSGASAYDKLSMRAKGSRKLAEADMMDALQEGLKHEVPADESGEPEQATAAAPEPDATATAAPEPSTATTTHAPQEPTVQTTPVATDVEAPAATTATEAPKQGAPIPPPAVTQESVKPKKPGFFARLFGRK